MKRAISRKKKLKTPQWQDDQDTADRSGIACNRGSSKSPWRLRAGDYSETSARFRRFRRQDSRNVFTRDNDSRYRRNAQRNLRNGSRRSYWISRSNQYRLSQNRKSAASDLNTIYLSPSEKLPRSSGCISFDGYALSEYFSCNKHS